MVALVCGVTFFVWKNYQNEPKDEKDKDKGQELLIQSEQKDDEEVDDEQYDDGKSKQYEGDNPNDAYELSGVVTYAGTTDDKLIIRANIDQFLSDGMCKLSLLKGDEVVYKESVGIISSASTATCEGFDVLMNKISGDELKIVIEIESGDKTGTIEGEVVL